MPEESDIKGKVVSNKVIKSVGGKPALAFVGGVVTLVLAAGVGWLLTEDTIDSNDITVAEPEFRDAEQVERQQAQEIIQGRQELLESDPDSVIDLGLLANAHLELEQYDEAISALDRAYELEPTDEATLASLADAYRQLENQEETVRYWEELVAVYEQRADREDEVELYSKFITAVKQGDFSLETVEFEGEGEPVINAPG